MNQHPTLQIGRIYFGITYEDEGLTYPIISSYEYIGLSTTNPGAHKFRSVGSRDSYVVEEGELDDFISTTEGLARTLKDWAQRNPTFAS